MIIEQTKDTSVIMPLLEQWNESYNGGVFGMSTTVDIVREELDGWLSIMCGDLLVAYNEKEPIGFFAIFALKSSFSNKPVAVEKYWYAQENHRLAGVKLFVSAKEWARENGCSHLITSASNLASDLHDKVSTFFERVGMQLFETSYIVRIN